MFSHHDVPGQADNVETLLRRAANGQIKLVTTDFVIAEIVWTLESFYKIPKDEIQEKVLAILGTPGLEISNADLLLQATTWYTEKNVDFIDAYNAAWMFQHNIEKVFTFDHKHFNRFEGLITPPIE